MKNKEKCFLVGIGNDGYRYRYSFEKSEGFKPLFCQFLFRLGFKGEADDYFTDYESEFPKKGKVKNLNDIVWNFKNENFDVDVFYGLEEIILIVRTNEGEILIKVVEQLFELKKFPNKKYVKNKISNKNKK